MTDGFPKAFLFSRHHPQTEPTPCESAAVPPSRDALPWPAFKSDLKDS